MTTQKEPLKQYVVHSTVRKAAHRTARARAASHTNRKHFIGALQTRLVPGQRLVITEEALHRDLAHLQAKEAQHVLEVRTLDGRRLDLKTLEPAAPAPKTVAPHFRLDSAAYDRPAGEYMPPYVGDDRAMPAVLPPGQKPDLLTQASAEAALDAAAVADAAPAPPTVDVDIDAAVEAAQSAASEEVDETTASAPAEQKGVSSGESSDRKGKKGSRR